MIIISDLHESYIQEVTKPKTAAILGGKSEYFPDINFDVKIAIVPIVQINAFTNNTINYADVNVTL